MRPRGDATPPGHQARGANGHGGDRRAHASEGRQRFDPTLRGPAHRRFLATPASERGARCWVDSKTCWRLSSSTWATVMSKRRARRNDRGIWRGVYASLVDHPDFRTLSRNARLVFLVMRVGTQNTIASIFHYYREPLMAQTGL